MRIRVSTKVRASPTAAGVPIRDIVGSTAAVIAIVLSLPEIPISCDKHHAATYGLPVSTEI
ncbi:hypothetical protein GCM10009546_27350 [Actinomadura livida]|uniref:Uncharacterized protein n=1 Tax=Actinomadura livida TaxID=79909 RepID=A0ABP3PD86_9ACTN|nr:hypothetical protein GCM10010208_36520 [Actinomadura livida]